MGQAQAPAVSEIHATRLRLDRELDELASYLPPTTERLKRAGMIVAGVMAAWLFVSYAVRTRRERLALRRLRSIEHHLQRMESSRHW